MTGEQNKQATSSEKQSQNVSNETLDQAELTTDNNIPFTVKKTPKRKKLNKLADAEETRAHGDDDNEADKLNGMPEPSPSKRQTKRQKHARTIVRNRDKEIEKTISYITKWVTNRDEWKYEKLRQIFIQKNIFDENIITNEHIDVALRYLTTSKGHSRTVIIEAAEAIIKETEDQMNDENQEELTASTRYERAREIVQTMQH